MTYDVLMGSLNHTRSLARQQSCFSPPQLASGIKWFYRIGHVLDTTLSHDRCTSRRGWRQLIILPITSSISRRLVFSSTNRQASINREVRVLSTSYPSVHSPACLSVYLILSLCLCVCVYVRHAPPSALCLWLRNLVSVATLLGRLHLCGCRTSSSGAYNTMQCFPLVRHS